MRQPLMVTAMSDNSGKLSVSREQLERVVCAISQVGVQDHLADYQLAAAVKGEVLSILSATAEDVRELGDEPVAYVMPGQIEAMKSVGWMHASRDKGKTGLEVSLYRHPQRPVVLPDRKRSPLSAGDEGWNACLDEFKRLNK